MELIKFNSVTIVHTTIVAMNKYYESIYQIICTGHWITDQISIELKEYDTTEPQFNVLKILKGSNDKPITVQEIQEQMVQRTSNVTRIVDRLLVKGLVTRVVCPSNRRKMDISITQKGKEFLEGLNQKVSNFHTPMRGNLSSQELVQLKSLIIKLKGEQL